MNSVKGAHAKMMRDNQENARREEEEKQAAEIADEERMRREEVDQAKKGWEEKRELMEADLKRAMEVEKNHDKVLKDSLERAMRVKSALSKDAAMIVARTAQTEMTNVREEIDFLNKKLKKHMLKKPKSSD